MGTLNKNQYLINFRKDVTSQFGEDGIIEKIFEIIPDLNQWCVEFGAWDGKFCSNTYNLIKNKNWHGVLIEADKQKIDEIKKTYADKSVIHVFNKFIEYEGVNSLDNLLSQTLIPSDFDFLSIDIDGNDYHIWESLINYQPKLVLIEFNALIPEDIEFVQANNPKVQHGNSILSMVSLGKLKGYELICINRDNAFFVDKKYFKLFNIANNSIIALKHYKAPLQVFQLYDGTIVFNGIQCLFYYNFPVDFNKYFQVLPKKLRNKHFPWQIKQNIFWKILYRFYWLIKKNQKIDVQSSDYCWSWINNDSSLID